MNLKEIRREWPDLAFEEYGTGWTVRDRRETLVTVISPHSDLLRLSGDRFEPMYVLEHRLWDAVNDVLEGL